MRALIPQQLWAFRLTRGSMSQSWSWVDAVGIQFDEGDQTVDDAQAKRSRPSGPGASGVVREALNGIRAYG
jgi:hypothetical protein